MPSAHTLSSNREAGGQSLWSALLVVLAAVVVLGWRVGASPLSGTEGHRAITAHQMLQSGEYLVPKLYGYTYLKKPPLDYWILAGFERVLGASEWVWRLPSVLAAGLLAAALVLFSGRWFGRTAGWVSGVAYLAMVPLWSQTRSADIDSLNSLATNLAVLVLVDLIWFSDSSGLGRRGAMALLGAVAMASGLMLKGPACLPLVIGLLIGSSILNRSPKPFSTLWVYIILLLGFAVLVAWYGSTRSIIAAQGLVPDPGGEDEAMRRMLIHNWNQVLPALLLGPMVFLYMLPVSAGIVVPFLPLVNQKLQGAQRLVARSLAGAVIVAFVICFISGMDNPRYAYLYVVPVCPLVGVVAELWRRGELTKTTRAIFGTILLATCAAMGMAAIVLMVMTGRLTQWNPPLISAIAMTGIVAVVAIVAWHRNAYRAGVIGLTVLLVFGALAFGEYKNRERAGRSAYQAAQQLRQLIGNGTPIATWYTVWAQPELFYYADADAKPMPIDELRKLDHGWMLLFRDRDRNPDEWEKVLGLKERSSSQGHVIKLNKAEALVIHRD
ncbi:MAG: glycosyltransferase family 39 protein [Phycisphaerales bacterium]|nr:glycosyltransferase family 39 protein [Phycisphaerales bacterium]